MATRAKEGDRTTAVVEADERSQRGHTRRSVLQKAVWVTPTVAAVLLSPHQLMAVTSPALTTTGAPTTSGPTSTTSQPTTTTAIPTTTPVPTTGP